MLWRMGSYSPILSSGGYTERCGQMTFDLMASDGCPMARAHSLLLEKHRKQDFLAYGRHSLDASCVVCQGTCHEVPRREPDCLCHQN